MMRFTTQLATCIWCMLSWCNWLI